MRIDGASVVVTGKIPGETRESVEAMLRAAGAVVQGAVTGSTTMLVTGEAVGARKLSAAKAKGVVIVPWEEAARMLAGRPVERNGNGGPVSAEVVPLAPRVRRPGAFAPMLARPATELPTTPGWVFEVKWDGFRCVATVSAGVVTLTSRSGLPLEFPRISESLAGLPDCVLDGEAVVLDEQGRSCLAELASAHSRAQLVVFDLVEASAPAYGQPLVSVRHLPFTQRRELLREMLRLGGPAVSESPVFEDGRALLDRAVEFGLEGVMCKRAASSYQDGKRSPDWLKVKIRCEQEFVVAGWVPGKGGREGCVGGLVLAVNDERGRLVYAGRVGAGVDSEVLRERFVELAASPLAVTPREEQRHATWVEPTVVVQVQFQRWTQDGRLWHPTYRGPRDDKRPADVVREPCAAAA